MGASMCKRQRKECTEEQSTPIRTKCTEEQSTPICTANVTCIEKWEPVVQPDLRTTLKHPIEKKTVRVVRGVRFSMVYVGGDSAFTAWSQNPPAINDSWEFDFDVECGAYEICFCGGNNPYHGIFTVEIDDQEVGIVDQYNFETVMATEHKVYWDCESAGRHTLRATVRDKNPISSNYWVCLKEVKFEPVLRRIPLILLLQAVHMEPQKIQITCMSIGGNKIATFLCDLDSTVGDLRAVAKEQLHSTWSVELTLPDGALLSEANNWDTLANIFQDLSESSCPKVGSETEER